MVKLFFCQEKIWNGIIRIFKMKKKMFTARSFGVGIGFDSCNVNPFFI